MKRSTPPLSDHWRDDAACLGMDTNIFFPVRGELPRLAQQVCAMCPVRRECLDYAHRPGQVIMFGVWGGLSEKQRRKLRSGRVSTHA